MSEVSKLASLLIQKGKEKTNEETDLMFGVVTSVNPLKIKVDNRFEITSEFILLSAFVKKLSINVAGGTTSASGGFTHNHSIKQDNQPFAGVTIDNHTVANHTHTMAGQEITLWDNLKVGERVIMLRVQGGQIYYVMERG